ncbi:hypothetical protein TNCV_1511421 [Trichonephila clavipes]|nr:hypothetical protein TNCV_1511421 [Trichonephila clavipes]
MSSNGRADEEMRWRIFGRLVTGQSQDTQESAFRMVETICALDHTSVEHCALHRCRNSAQTLILGMPVYLKTTCDTIPSLLRGKDHHYGVESVLA